MPTLTYDTVNGYHCAEHGKGYCEHWKAIGNSKPARKEVMDLTKLRDKWRKRAEYFQNSSNKCGPSKADSIIGCIADLDAALAAVPQDTVEAVRVAALRPIGTHFTLTQLEQVDAAIRAVLAARPVRAVLTEEQVRVACRGVNLKYSEVANDYASLTAALNAALDRQHAEPPKRTEAK